MGCNVRVALSGGWRNVVAPPLLGSQPSNTDFELLFVVSDLSNAMDELSFFVQEYLGVSELVVVIGAVVRGVSFLGWRRL